MTVYVFGHRNPDTDAICAAIAYADYLQRTHLPDAVAACCGAPNRRTEYALRRARLMAPRIIMDVRPEVSDVCRTDPIVAYDDEVFQEVYERMSENKLGALPVLNREGKFLGLLTLLDLMKVIFEGDDDPIQARQVCSSVRKICDVLKGEFQHCDAPDEKAKVMVMVGAMSAEGFTKRLNQFHPSETLVVSGNRPTIQLPALERGVRVLVVTGAYELSPGLLQLAQLNRVTVIKSAFDTATTTMRIKSARRIESAIQTDCLAVSSKLPVADARKLVDRSRQNLFPVLDDKGKLFGVLSKSDLVNPPKPKLVLVDHNELSQAVQGADESEIVEVLDHHRVGGNLKSDHPIRFINEPVGSTCTLVAKQFRGAGLIPTPGIAICMASGIISDTLHLRSPTTTEVDRELLEWLKSFANIDLDDFVREFFEVGSALQSQPAARVVREDCKEFVDRGHRFSISQIEEIGFDLFWERSSELLEALVELTEERSLDFSALLVTDIVSNGSLLLMSHEPDFWEAINYPRLERNLYQLEDVVSRKKQLLPLISQLLENSLNSVGQSEAT
ncbi:putative manganese-dependent inorganic diphosphatase [Aureliella helgolandensis]|uniref:inorganic diphosphatase n=1 Tax=Aureliella helgolandensis TaxID=2527968 RepID=A0A518G369_9BACT|nr:putative manganese-dependent inorganic diphosphatase [Aureliella helgolandensis]QDV23051.1 Cobalt-dependent inorganic pyrophosphatase [Aureliella helgolandensis]